MKLINPEEVERPKKSVSNELKFPVTLPSKGKHGYVDTVYCRPLKVGDIKSLIVTDIKDEIAYVRNLVKVIGSTIVDPPDFDIMQMTWNDFIKLLVAHRVNSLGSLVDLRYDCDACGIQYVTFDLVKDLEEIALPEDYPGDPFEVDGFSFRFPRLSVFWKVDTKTIDELTDIDLVRDALLQDYLVDDLPYSTYAKVTELINKYSAYGVQKELFVKCPKCGTEQVVPIPFFLLLVKGRVV